jgi:hypothetical protein
MDSLIAGGTKTEKKFLRREFLGLCAMIAAAALIHTFRKFFDL